MSRALYALNTHRHVQYTVSTSMRVHANLKVFPPTRIIIIHKMGPFFTLCTYRRPGVCEAQSTLIQRQFRRFSQR